MKQHVAVLTIGSAVTFAAISRPAEAATSYTFNADPITYFFCNNFAEGGRQCPGQFLETVTFSNPFTFTFTAPGAITNVNETAVRTVEKTASPIWTFNAGTYDPGSNLLTFTGPDVIYGIGAQQVVTPTRFSIIPNAPLVDSGGNATIQSYELASFGTVCKVWQNNGNTNCEPGDLILIPSPFSALALLPLTLFGKLRNRYRFD